MNESDLLAIQQQDEPIYLQYEWLFTRRQYDERFDEINTEARSAMRAVAKRRGYTMQPDSVRVHYAYNYRGNEPQTFTPGPPPAKEHSIRPILRMRVKWEAMAERTPVK